MAYIFSIVWLKHGTNVLGVDLSNTGMEVLRILSMMILIFLDESYMEKISTFVALSMYTTMIRFW